MTGRRFVLVDRDGTINEEVDHLDDPDDLVLIPGAAAALRRLRKLRFGLVVVTNQAQIGRGFLTERRLSQIHERLVALLEAEDAGVDAILHCPHAPEAGCECRKPRPGLALEAAARFGFDLSEAFVVGDHGSDIEMGRSVGATTILVLTGHGAAEAAAAHVDADHVAPDLAAATDIIAGLIEREATA